MLSGRFRACGTIVGKSLGQPDKRADELTGGIAEIGFDPLELPDGPAVSRNTAQLTPAAFFDPLVKLPAKKAAMSRRFIHCAIRFSSPSAGRPPEKKGAEPPYSSTLRY